MRALLLALVATPVPALACSFVPWQDVVVDPLDSDGVGPEAAVVVDLAVHRGQGPEVAGCAVATTSCDDVGRVTLDLDLPAEAVGVRITLAEGSLPEGLGLPADPVAPFDGAIVLVWTDEATHVQEPLDFVLTLRTVDAAGDEGEALDVVVQDPGSGGCAASTLPGRPAPAGPLLVVLAAGALLRRRRADERRPTAR
ncbi:MAG: hypothetical protein H6732_03435 [Alphaproteobacteria bacterium]|nr:hypothetical protein [Alphaproteobacteria bacterium]